MPQKAIRDDGTSIFAFVTEGDEEWSEVVAAGREGKLLLPCCGAPAIPKTNERQTRWFAHGPYKKIACDWKSTDFRHEAVVAAICTIAEEEHDWLVDTEVRGEGWRADVLCRREKADVQVAFQVELQKRSDEEVLAEDAAFEASDILAVWVFPKRRYNRPSVSKAESIPTGENANTVGEAAALATKVLSRIGGCFRNANAAIRALKKEGWQGEPVFDRKVPVAVKATRLSDGKSATFHTEHRVNLGPIYETAVPRREWAQLQKSVGLVLKRHLDQEVELWWPGYPGYFEADREPWRKGQNRWQIEQEARTPRGRFPPAAIQDAPLMVPPTRPPPPPPLAPTPAPPPEEPVGPDPELLAAAQRGEKAVRPPMDEWAEARARHIWMAANTVMTSDAATEWMDTRNVILNGLTPHELAASSSDAISDCEVALGLRDPVTREKIYR